jgi:hypothetical protein
VHPNVRFVGHQTTRQTAHLMANSRAVLNCQPTYPRNIHERISVGMLCGSCVITDRTPFIAACFTDNELLAYEPQTQVSLVDLYSSRDVRAIAAAGAAKVRATPHYGWDAHFDGLLQAARAPMRAVA